MIQTIHFQRARVPLVAIGALALVAVAGVSLPKLSSNSAAETTVVAAPSTSVAERPVVEPKSDTTACGAGAYVTGDLVGDASPAAIYATMCGDGR